MSLIEVSCIQYEPEANRSKNEAERIAILQVCRALRKRGFYGGIFYEHLKYRDSARGRTKGLSQDLKKTRLTFELI
ncbi:MAG: hypothetical protein ABSB53_05705 [Nitrososphaerales archaeon]|jgi:hypothetical protein